MIINTIKSRWTPRIEHLLVLVMSIGCATCISCYTCASTAAGVTNRCQHNHAGLVNASRKWHNDSASVPDGGLVVNCSKTNPAWNRCMILSKELNGQIALYQRGCSDGKDKTFEDSRFEQIDTTSNHTVCAEIFNKGLICYTYCDTDICNGPTLPPVAIDPCSNYTGKDPRYDYIPEACGSVGVSCSHCLLVVTVILSVLSFHKPF